MNKRKLGILIILLIATLGLKAQRATSLIINEVLVVNDSNYQDDYGMHSAWIEIYNTSFASVDLKGCFLTNDRNNPTKYPIPKSDVLTKIKPRQHALFWADSMPNRGTFHLNFTLNPNKDNYIALYDSNGKTLIDEIVIPAGQIADHSYARIEDGSDKWVTKGGTEHSYVTPSTNNMTIDRNLKTEKFKEHDAQGIGLSISAMAVVFCGLILLFISFKIIGNMAIKMSARNEMKTHGITDKDEAKTKAFGQQAGEIFAAIAMAMHECQENVHDVENTVITINRVKRRYSPWSSKIYTLRETPHRK